MDSLSWLSLLCKGWRLSQIKTFTALWEAFVLSKSAILTNIARELTGLCNVAIDHTVKRLNRFLGNPRIDRQLFYKNVVEFVWPRIKHWQLIPIAIDWTFCEKHEKWQSLVASIVIRGRGIPILVWSFPRNDFHPYLSQNQVENAFMKQLREILPPGKRVVILADRGFARASFFRLLTELGFDFIIRLRYNVKVTIGENVKLLGNIAVSKGQKLEWANVMYRQDGTYKLARLVATRAAVENDDMDPWFLASSLHRSAKSIINLYTKRMIIEEDFRTAKSNLKWKYCRIRKVEHYRQFVLLMVATLVFSMLIGMAAKRKPSLAKLVVRKRKGKLDTSCTLIGIHLLRHSFKKLVYLELMGRLPSPT